MDSEKDIILIGVGLPRTGNFSTKIALEMILPGKCYNMFEALDKHDEFWIRMCNNDIEDEEIKEFFLSKGFVAIIDAPAIFFYKRLMRVFPNAKFLLNTRNPSTWTSSVTATVYEAYHHFARREVISSWMGPFGKLVFGEKLMHIVMKSTLNDYSHMLESCENGTGEEFFKNWNNRIMSDIPKEKLLVSNVNEGWEPLCKFLNVSISSEMFPRLNDREAFVKMLRFLNITMYLKAFLFWSLPTAAVGVGLYVKCF